MVDSLSLCLKKLLCLVSSASSELELCIPGKLLIYFDFSFSLQKKTKYLVFSDLFHNIRAKGQLTVSVSGSPLPDRSDITQAADQSTVLLFPPRMLISIIIKGNYRAQLRKSGCNS